MKLSQLFKKLGIILLFFVSILVFELSAQSIEKRILLYPMAGNGVKAEEASSIANDIRTNLINQGYKFAADPRVVLKLAGDKQKIYEEVKELGNIYRTDYIMPCTLDKLNQTYKINCEIYHKIKVENGKEEWESWAGTGTVKYGNSLEDLSKKITNKTEKDSISERLKVEDNTAKSSCKNVSGDFFIRRLKSCSQSSKTQTSDELYSNCFGIPTETVCEAKNTSDNCRESCRQNVTTLLVYFALLKQIEQSQKEIEQCYARGNYYSYNLEKKSCEYANPNEVAEKEAKAKKDCESKAPDYYWSSSTCKLTDAAAIRLKKECEKDELEWAGDHCKNPPKPEHDGSASWIIPGLGLALKNRPILGILAFGATAAAYSDYAKNYKAYINAKENYESFIPVPIPIFDMGLVGNYLYFDMKYKAYEKSADTASDSANLLFYIYAFQVILSYRLDADYKFLSFFESERKEALTYRINIKRDSSFGVPNSFGTLYTFSFTWGF
ncbi:MAG: hypothetical protein IPL26_20975 [Leptospiraceae bacterium]|nr:hypothetical protein [Leptospiraceae bacterium]